MTHRPFSPTSYTVRRAAAPEREHGRTRQLALAMLVIVVLVILAQPPIFALVFEGDFIGSVATYGLPEDSPIVTALLALHHLIF